MFGHQDDKSSKKDTGKDTTVVSGGPADSVDEALNIESTGSTGKTDEVTKPDASPDTAEVTPDETAKSEPATDTEAPDPAPKSDDSDAWQHPGVPIDNSPEPISDVIAPSGGSSAPSFPPSTSSSSYHNFPDNSSDDTPHELIDIKQKALNKLTPLVDQLDQTPEDKFRTTMMMIQASDDQSMVKMAYEAAEAIEDGKARAQALLDIVNEINYFTQHHDQ